jgi:hypothetical protein
MNRTVCNNCMQLKELKEFSKGTICYDCVNKTKNIGVKYIGLFSDCIFINNMNIRCKRKCVSKDDFNLFVCEKHASKIPIRLEILLDSLKSKK